MGSQYFDLLGLPDLSSRFKESARLQRFPRRRKEVETNPDMVKSKQDRCGHRYGNKYVTNKTRVVVEQHIRSKQQMKLDMICFILCGCGLKSRKLKTMKSDYSDFNSLRI